MTSTLKADVLTSKTTNGDLTISGDGSGVPNIETGFKVGGTAGVPVSALRVGTDGELITWDSSGVAATVPVGTATHLLTSNGAGAAPTFQAAAGGGAWSVLSSGTASAVSSLALTGFTTKNIQIIISDLNGTSGDFNFTYSNDDGSTYVSTNYFGFRHRLRYSDSAEYTGSAFVQTGQTPGSNAQANGLIVIDVPDPSNTATLPIIYWNFCDAVPTTDTFIAIGMGSNTAASDVDAVKIVAASGTFECTYVVLELN